MKKKDARLSLALFTRCIFNLTGLADVIVNYEVPETAAAYQQRLAEPKGREQLVVTLVKQASLEDLQETVLLATGSPASSLPFAFESHFLHRKASLQGMSKH